METKQPQTSPAQTRENIMGTDMKLIWNDLLHANFRCGRMCGDRAEHLAVNCTMPSCCARMCTRM